MSIEKRTPISVKEAIKRIMKQQVEVKNINVNLDESIVYSVIKAESRSYRCRFSFRKNN